MAGTSEHRTKLHSYRDFLTERHIRLDLVVVCAHAFATPAQPKVENALRASREVAKIGVAIAAEAVCSCLLETKVLKCFVKMTKNVPLV